MISLAIMAALSAAQMNQAKKAAKGAQGQTVKLNRQEKGFYRQARSRSMEEYAKARSGAMTREASASLGVANEQKDLLERQSDLAINKSLGDPDKLLGGFTAMYSMAASAGKMKASEAVSDTKLGSMRTRLSAAGDRMRNVDAIRRSYSTENAQNKAISEQNKATGNVLMGQAAGTLIQGIGNKFAQDSINTTNQIANNQFMTEAFDTSLPPVTSQPATPTPTTSFIKPFTWGS